MGVFQNNLMGAAAAAAASAGGGDFYSHQIANSCRFQPNGSSLDSTEYLSRTQGTPTNVDKCTISFWIKRSEVGSRMYGMTGSGYSGQYSYITFGGDGSDADHFFWLQNPGSITVQLESNALFRDTSAWYHIVIANDSTQSTAADRNKIYINGVHYTDWGDFTTYSTLNSDFLMNASGHKIFVGSGGASASNAYLPLNGYIAEYCFVDGTQYAATDFGESKNGVWIPKDPSGLTFGNNGCYLKFESSSDLGNDSSGNNNDFTVTGVSAHDQMLDSPTFGSEGSANFPTVNVLDPTLTASVVSNGNLQLTETISNFGAKANFAIPLTGKWYWEAYVNNGVYQETWAGITGITADSSGDGRGGSDNATTYGASWSNYSGSNMYIRKYIAGVESSESGSFGTTTDTIIGIAINRDDDEAKFYKDNALQFTTAISATQEYFPAGGGGGGTDAGTIGVWNFGQDGTFAGNETAQGNADGNGYGNFYYSPPTDHLALCSGNLPTATEVDPAETDDDYPSKLFGATIWTGDETTGRAITGVGFQPDWLWFKSRGSAFSHRIYDTTRGITSNGGWRISSDTNAAQVDKTSSGQDISAVGTDGFTLGSSSNLYTNDANDGGLHCNWAWRANGGTTSTNSNGSVDSTVQADPSGSFSIVTYRGGLSSAGAATVGHGLSSPPSFIIHKGYANTGGGDANWSVRNNALTSWDYILKLDTTASPVDKSGNGTMAAPTSTVFSVNYTDGLGAGSMDVIAYCFANCEGYIKAGSYEGNGDADGTFVYTGFRPAFIMTKSIDSTSDWQMFDNKRLGYNVDNNELQANETDAETTTDMIDILSNGFKLRIATDPNVAETYIYLAMAHNPFQYATAR
jgi:hypothetical protein